MDTLDVRNLSEEQREALNDHIRQILKGAFVREEFDQRHTNIDLAIKQEYQDEGYNQAFVPINAVFNSDTSNIEAAYLSEAQRGTDEFSDLYLPVLLRARNVLFVNIKNLCFPANGDWVGIQRCYSALLSSMDLKDFLPFSNEAWIKILKTQNQRYNFKTKYGGNLDEVIKYGNTVLLHHYDSENHFVDVIQPGIRNAGIYPLTDRWRESNAVLQYDENYNNLIGREDIDQEIIEKIVPSTTYADSKSLAKLGSNRKQQFDNYNLPYGKVRLYDIFMPSLYIKTNRDQVFIAKNIYLTVALDPEMRPGELSDGDNCYILKAYQGVDPYQHGILFGSYGQNSPGVFYHTGALSPFIPHQIAANQLFSGYVRIAANVAEPAFTRNSTDGLLDTEQTPQNDYIRGAFYDNVKIEAIIRSDYAQAMESTLNGLEVISSEVESGIGISKGQQGIINQGRTSATEIKEAYSGSQLQLTEAADQFDNQILRPSVSIRINLTQRILRDQVEETLKQLGQEADQQMLELILKSNPLFQSLLDMSGIQEAYKDFYELTMKQVLEDQGILLQMQGIEQEIQAMLEFAKAPLPPQPPINPNFPPEQTQQMLEQYNMQVQQMQQQQQQALQQAEQKKLELRKTELMFKGTKEPPELSLGLLYQILVDPIKDSDITVTGSFTTVSKELARQNLNDFMLSVANYPQETLAKMDFTGILQLQARANDLPVRELMKSPAELMRDEEAARVQAEQQQQLVMNAAQVPGAQIPQAS